MPGNLSNSEIVKALQEKLDGKRCATRHDKPTEESELTLTTKPTVTKTAEEAADDEDPSDLIAELPRR